MTSLTLRFNGITSTHNVQGIMCLSLREWGNQITGNGGNDNLIFSQNGNNVDFEDEDFIESKFNVDEVVDCEIVASSSEDEVSEDEVVLENELEINALIIPSGPPITPTRNLLRFLNFRLFKRPPIPPIPPFRVLIKPMTYMTFLTSTSWYFYNRICTFTIEKR